MNTERTAPTRTGRNDQEKELDKKYGDESVALMKGAMGLMSVDFNELQKRLADNGTEIAISTLRKKVNGGNCKASFMLKVMDALNVDLAPIKKN